MPHVNAVYVPRERRPGVLAVRVIEVVTRRPGRANASELALGFRARCDTCGWIGRMRSTRPAALRTADRHTCLPVAGGAAVSVSDLTRIPWLPP